MLQFIAFIGLVYMISNPDKIVNLLPSNITEDEKKEIVNNLSSISEGLYGTSKTILEIALRLWMGKTNECHSGGEGSGPFGNPRDGDLNE
jgi:hypothetical protein